MFFRHYESVIQFEFILAQFLSVFIKAHLNIGGSMSTLTPSARSLGLCSLYQVPTDQEGYAVARYSKEFPLSTQNRKEILRSSSIVKPASNL